jgi:ubiquinone/menaquinone biosynthesis C-methylase UbiE
MYDKEYAKSWISYNESRTDSLRTNYLYPFMRQSLKSLKNKSRVLDIGCGWGASLAYFNKDIDYFGVDPTKEFFSYIKSKYPNQEITLKQGKLPGDIPFQDNSFDLVLCSMTLHCLKNWKEAIKTIFSKTKLESRVIIIDFRESGEGEIRRRFLTLSEDRGDYLRGIYKLSRQVQLELEIYLHKEKDIEKELKKYGIVKKTHLGPVYVAYECIKN